MGLVSTIVGEHAKMKIAFIVLALATIAFAFPEVPEGVFEDQVLVAKEAPEENLVAVVANLRNVASEHMTYHVNRIAKHASLMQEHSGMDEDKAKAYAHNFAASKAAIKAALKSLTDQLNAGHKHDKNALATAKNAGANAISKSVNSGKAKSEADAATAAHNKAISSHESAMAAFKTSLTLMVNNAHTACKNAHNEYNALKSEVAANVASRKQVFIASVVVTCYVDNLTSNAGAKTCADKARRADVSQWNINAGSLAPCVSTSSLTSTMGPASWSPTVDNCKGVGHTTKPKVTCAAGEKPDMFDMNFVQMMAGQSRHFSTDKSIFLKGKYIELGIDKKNGGRYGAEYKNTAELKANGFYGRQKGAKIGMVGDGDGFGVGKDLRIDYFLPGTHEERFQTGYTLSGKQYKQFNYDKSFSDTSKGNTASSKSTGKDSHNNIEVTQHVSLGENDMFFRTRVVVKNIGGKTLQDVRYGRSCDPDNTVDMGGSYTTENHIASTFAAGDKFASVGATSMKGDSYAKKAGTEAQLVYASVDKRAIPAYGNSGLYPKNGVYNTEVNTPHAKDKKHKKDAWIGMFVKFGDMKPGQTETFIFDTWMAKASVKIDEETVSKVSAKIATTEGCAGVACPSGSTGHNVRSG